MVTLLLGRAGSGKTNRIFAKISERVAAGQGGTVLLVPEQYSHEAERELCRAAGDRLSAFAEVLSFSGLARKVFAECGGARKSMDAGGRILCMAAAMEQAAPALKLYGHARRDARMLPALLHAVDELKNAGLDGESLQQTAMQTDGALRDKLTDLALVTEAFNAVQAQSGADAADVLTRLAELIGDAPSVKGCFFVDGFSDFTALEQEVLHQIIAAGAELTVALGVSDDGEEELASALPEKTARWIERVCAEEGVQCTREWMNGAEDDGVLPFFCAHLFDFSRPEAPENKGELSLVSAATVWEECELAAAKMRQLAMRGCRWRDMAVAVRGFDDYRAALEAACAMYGVPVFLSGRGDILRKSLPLAISSALEAVTHGYEYEAMFSYLKTGLAGIEPAELDELENYVILWNIRGAMWQRDFTMHPEGYNHPSDENSTAQLAALNALRVRIIEPLQRLEQAGRMAATAEQQAAALAQFLENIALAQTLERRGEALAAAGEDALAMEYSQLWELICAALEQFAAVLGDSELSAENFAALWSLMLGQYDVGVIPVSLDRVQAGEMDKMRRRHIRHLFVLGAAEGRLPAPDAGAGLFSPEERVALKEMDVALSDAEEDLCREFGCIYNCLALPSDSLTLSWARTDAEGGEARPSVVVQRAKTLFGMEEERGDIAKARMSAPQSARMLAVMAAAGDSSPEAIAARAVLEKNGQAEEIERLGAAASRPRGSLSPEAVRAIYGKKPALSASRAEKFNACRFGYFLQYGLKAKPRQQAVFDPRDYGTFMHEVLKNVAAEVRERGGFGKVSRAEVEDMAERYVARYVSEKLNDFAEKTPRFVYLFSRLRRTVRKVCAELWEELSVSDFEPLAMELDLRGEGIVSDDGELRLSGQIDRVDGWLHDGALYLRITDYKTGKKSFSLSDLCRGMDMQMLLYLFTLTKNGGDYFGGAELRPAGILYSPARTELVSADGDVDDAELADKSAGSRKRSGLVLDDPAVIEAMEHGAVKRFIPVKFNKNGSLSEENIASAERFGALERYIEKTLKSLAESLRAGSVEADPWFKNARDNACALCDYRDACLFDEEKDCRRPVTHLKTAEAWEKIEHGEV